MSVNRIPPGITVLLSLVMMLSIIVCEDCVTREGKVIRVKAPLLSSMLIKSSANELRSTAMLKLKPLAR